MEIAAEKGFLDVLKLLVEKGGADDVHENGYLGRTPLHIACLHGNLDCAQYLVSEGADIDAKDNDGRTPHSEGFTPLHLACFKGELDCAQYLVSQGADIEAENNVRHRPPAAPTPHP